MNKKAAAKTAASTAPEVPEDAFFSAKDREVIRRNYLSKFSENEQELFLTICERTQLDPTLRQIYAIERQENIARNNEPPKWVTKMIIVTSIEGLRTIAERTGQYEGQTHPEWANKDGVWKDLWLKEGNAPYAAQVGVRRKGFAEPLYGVARFESFVQMTGGKDPRPTRFWMKAPDVMLLKCAEANALRRAFPQQLAGLSIEEEVPTDAEIVDGAVYHDKADKAPPAGKWVPGHEPAGEAKEPKKPKEKAEKAEDPKPEAKPTPEPEKPAAPAPTVQKPAPDPEIPAAAADKPQFPAGTSELPESIREYTITCIQSAEFKNVKIGSLTPDQIKRAKVGWVDAYKDKIASNPAKVQDAAAIESAYSRLFPE